MLSEDSSWGEKFITTTVQTLHEERTLGAFAALDQSLIEMIDYCKYDLNPPAGPHHDGVL